MSVMTPAGRRAASAACACASGGEPLGLEHDPHRGHHGRQQVSLLGQNRIVFDGSQLTARSRDQGQLPAGANGSAAGAPSASVYVSADADQRKRRTDGIMERAADGSLQISERRRRTGAQDELGHPRPRHARPEKSDPQRDRDQQL